VSGTCHVFVFHHSFSIRERQTERSPASQLSRLEKFSLIPVPSSLPNVLSLSSLHSLISVIISIHHYHGTDSPLVVLIDFLLPIVMSILKTDLDQSLGRTSRHVTCEKSCCCCCRRRRRLFFIIASSQKPP